MAYSKAQNKATQKYKKASYKRIPLDVRVEEYDVLKEYCDSKGEPINGFIRRIIKEAIENG